MTPRRRLLRLAFTLPLGAALSAVLGAGAMTALADPPPHFAPDPPAHPDKKHWLFDIAVTHGKLSITKAKSLTLAKPAETKRATGRFALELYIGKQLLDRARFNVPMMSDEPPVRSNKRAYRGPSLDDVTTHVTAEIADHSRATYLLLVDRVTGDTQRFDWPPEPDGHLVPWKEGRIAEAGPGDFPDGGARVVSQHDPADAGSSDAGSSDAGRD
ncbi:MAG: hypothetical protein U0359_25890 [Byssovorax sp.]